MPFILNKPLFLAFCLLIPSIWLMMGRPTAGRGLSRRQLVAGILRSLLIIVMALALADPVHLKHSDQVNVFFCLDVSDSIPIDQRLEAEEFIARSAAEMKKADQIGLIVFGKDPALEFSLKTELDALNLKSIVNSHNTNIHDALQLAIGRFPESGTNKIVILSDGNQNLAHAAHMAYLAASLDIKIYPVPLRTWFGKEEAFVKTLDTPANVALERPFENRLVIVSSARKTGELAIMRNETLIIQQPIELNPGTNAITFADMLSEPGLYLYRAVVNFTDDTFFQNNEGLSFTEGTRKANILYLVDKDRGVKFLVDALQLQGLNVDRRHINRIPGSIHGLVDYNAIILDNISGRSISYTAMEQIERYVKDTGGGLIMIGGERSFGAGYYKKTPVEKALPVYMDTPTDIKLPELYLLFVIDKSSSMTASYKDQSKLEMAKIAAFSSIEMLNPIDRVGIVTFDTEFDWTVPFTSAGERSRIAANLSRVIEGGGTDLHPALADAKRVFEEIDSGRKHIIVLSDGETEEADFRPLIQSMSASGISISTVSIGHGANIGLMRSIAEWGRGRSYFTDDPANIPKIFAGETKIVSKKVIVEKNLQPIVIRANEILAGLTDITLPNIYGQIITYPKPGSELLIETGQGPLLAVGQYGLGRSVAFTSDLSNRWGKDWVRWEHYGKFVSQMVKWAQRKETAKRYLAAMDHEGEIGKFRVDVVSEQNRYVNNLTLNINIMQPSGKNQTIAMEQIAPGRYAAAFPAEEIGAYYFSVYDTAGEKAATPRTFGFGIPHTAEFENTMVNEKLLEGLAKTTNGRMLSIDQTPDELFSAASGSSKKGSRLWPYLIMTALLLLIGEVAARKIF